MAEREIEKIEPVIGKGLRVQEVIYDHILPTAQLRQLSVNQEEETTYVLLKFDNKEKTEIRIAVNAKPHVGLEVWANDEAVGGMVEVAESATIPIPTTDDVENEDLKE